MKQQSAITNRFTILHEKKNTESFIYQHLNTLLFRKIQGQEGTAVAQWLRCCATNRKIACSIPAGVGGFFIDIKLFPSHCFPGVDSASNRNDYQEYFLGAKRAGV